MVIFLFFLITYVLANVITARFVKRSDNSPFQKRMIIASTWIIPFFGAMVAVICCLNRPTPNMASEPLIPGVLTDIAPTMLQLGEMGSLDLEANMEAINGFPLLRWETVSQWISSTTDEALRMQASEAAKRSWLLHMRDFLGDSYRLYESEQVYMLSRLENVVVIAAAKYLTRESERIHHALGNAARSGPRRRDVLLVIDDPDVYDNYVACYAGYETLPVRVEGVHLNGGCPHIAIIRESLIKMEPVITRELARGAVSHMDIPFWLTEGLATYIQHRFHGMPLYRDPQAIRRSHEAYWGEGAIQEFWSGKSFSPDNDLSALSYDLARIVTENMAKEWKPFMEFVRHARRSDAGRQAAIENMGIDLGAFVCALLGRPATPRWSPIPSLWENSKLDVI